MPLSTGLFVSVDETVAESHDLMASCVRFVKENKVSPQLGAELKKFFSIDVIQNGSITLADQNLVYRSLPLSLQVRVIISQYYTAVVWAYTGKKTHRL